MYSANEIQRRSFLKGLVAASGTVATVGAVSRSAQASSLAMGSAPGRGYCINVREAGVKGDGVTHEADLLQQVLDYVAAQGGGVVRFPVGRYILEKTLLIPSGVHLIGEGRSTIFTGYRPEGIRGRALIANRGITTHGGYDGAHDFSIQHVALDTPLTNGIVLVHARNVYFSNIYGLDAHHHHFDIAGSKNVVSENIFLTGRSGTAPFQVDGVPYNNNIWDGTQPVPPYSDETPNDGIFLSNSIIHPTNRPRSGYHLHRDGGQNIFVDNVIIEHVRDGIHRDPNTHRKDVFINNVVIKDVRSGIKFDRTDKPDERISINNVVIQDGGEGPLVRYHGCKGLTLQNISVLGESVSSDTAPLQMRSIERLAMDDVQVLGSGGPAISLEDCAQAFVSRIVAENASPVLDLDGCKGIRHSGLCAIDSDGNEKEVLVNGAGQTSPWN